MTRLTRSPTCTAARLAVALGASVESIQSNGPGSYSGPIVGSAQALAVLVASAAVLAGLAALLLRRRDVE